MNHVSCLKCNSFLHVLINDFFSHDREHVVTEIKKNYFSGLADFLCGQNSGGTRTGTAIQDFVSLIYTIFNQDSSAFLIGTERNQRMLERSAWRYAHRCLLIVSCVVLCAFTDRDLCAPDVPHFLLHALVVWCQHDQYLVYNRSRSGAIRVSYL